MGIEQRLRVAANRPNREADARPRRSIRHHPAPPPGVDLREQKDEWLERFGLPRRPDQKSQPRLFDFWYEFLSPRPLATSLRFIPAGSPVQDLRFIRSGGFVTTPPLPSRYERSANWSGTYLSPHGGHRFVGITGWWRVPTPAIPADGGAELELGQYRSSTWVGLDGQRLYRHSSLPQIGTSQVVDDQDGSQKLYGAWWQWWAPGRDDNEAQPLPLVIAAGDEIMAMLEVLEPTTVRFRIKNHSASTMLTVFDVEYPSFPKDASLRFFVSGATAEWVLERPSPTADELAALLADQPRPAFYELPHYGSCLFTRCIAESEGTDGIRHEHDLGRGSLIHMYDVRREPTRARTISAAKRVKGDDQALEVESWLG